MKLIGQFRSAKWGAVNVMRGTYGSPTGPLAVLLQSEWGEPLATLSVNMYTPECSRGSADLPADCFYVNEWSGGEVLAREGLDAGVFKLRDDLPKAQSGFVEARVSQIVSPA